MNLLLAVVLLSGLSNHPLYSPSPTELQSQRVQAHQSFMVMNRLKVELHLRQQELRSPVRRAVSPPGTSPGTSLYWQNYYNNVHKNRMYQLQKYQQLYRYGYPYYNPYYHYPFGSY